MAKFYCFSAAHWQIHQEFRYLDLWAVILHIRLFSVWIFSMGIYFLFDFQFYSMRVCFSSVDIVSWWAAHFHHFYFSVLDIYEFNALFLTDKHKCKAFRVTSKDGSVCSDILSCYLIMIESLKIGTFRLQDSLGCLFMSNLNKILCHTK